MKLATIDLIDCTPMYTVHNTYRQPGLSGDFVDHLQLPV